jgi:transcriptional regulator with GAF, ATPase, and Fis domain
MSVVAFSPSRFALQEELRPFERVAIELFSTLNSIERDGIGRVLSRALEEIGTAFGVDQCTWLEFDHSGGVRIAGAWAARPYAPCRDQDVAGIPSVIERLSHNMVVAATIPELPGPCQHVHADHQGDTARLAVPVSLNGRVAYALLVGNKRRHTEWRTAFVDRLKLVAEMLASVLGRQPHAAPVAVVQEEVDGGVRGLGADAVYLHEEARNRVEADQIIGDSTSLRVAMSRLEQVAPLDATVLLRGETGTGKELFARALHDRSRRRRRTLIRVNCAALPPSLIESELFGHERGAFTGAVSMRQGRFELADGGTIFLDEIGDLAPELQAKLLRVLQEGEFERVGSSKTRRVDVRVIAATHHDLEKAIADGRFRSDLFYRLSVFPIDLPPLRDRPEDVPQLVWFLIHRKQRDFARRITRVPTPVMQALQHHDWPGNVRELENVIERAMIRSVDGTLQLDDLLPSVDTREIPSRGCGETLDAVQRCHIEKVLRTCGWRINGAGNAAMRLGLHPNTLRFRMKKLGVSKPARPVRPAPAAGLGSARRG